VSAIFHFVAVTVSHQLDWSRYDTIFHQLGKQVDPRALADNKRRIDPEQLYQRGVGSIIAKLVSSLAIARLSPRACENIAHQIYVPAFPDRAPTRGLTSRAGLLRVRPHRNQRQTRSHLLSTI
jgi:hypothetical protein